GNVAELRDVCASDFASARRGLERVDDTRASHQRSEQGRVVTQVHSNVDHHPTGFNELQKGCGQLGFKNSICGYAFAHGLAIYNLKAWQIKVPYQSTLAVSAQCPRAAEPK